MANGLFSTSEFRNVVRSLSSSPTRRRSVMAEPTIRPVAETISIRKPIFVRISEDAGETRNATTIPKFSASNPITTPYIPLRMAIQIIGTNAR